MAPAPRTGPMNPCLPPLQAVSRSSAAIRPLGLRSLAPTGRVANSSAGSCWENSPPVEAAGGAESRGGCGESVSFELGVEPIRFDPGKLRPPAGIRSQAGRTTALRVPLSRPEIRLSRSTAESNSQYTFGGASHRRVTGCRSQFGRPVALGGPLIGADEPAYLVEMAVNADSLRKSGLVDHV